MTDPQINEALKTAGPIFRKLTGAEFVPVRKNFGTPGEFNCRVEDGKLFVEGDAEGIRCGIYRVLQKLGLRWFNPAEEIIVPNKPAAALKELDGFREKPSFPYRGLHICAGKHHYEDRVGRWMSFNCMNRKLTHLPEDDIIGTRLRELGLSPDTTVHAYSLIIPDRKYFESNPEFFALVGGKRIGQENGGQLCLSNPKMRETFARELHELIRQKPHIGVYGICPNDGYGWCECEKCAALDTPEDRKNKQVNGRVADFAADICARMEKSDPTAYIGHYSYSNFADFADHLKVLPKNLVVSFTQFHCYRHVMNDPSCPKNKPQWERMNKLLSKTGNLYIYDYYSHNWNGMPAPIWKTVGDDFKAWRKLNIHGFLSEAPGAENSSWDSFWPVFYTAAQMMWNADNEPDVLMQDWCRARYGLAAEPMTAYFRQLESSLYAGNACFLKAPDDLRLLLPPITLQKCAEDLDAAAKLEPGNRLLAAEKQQFESWRNNLSRREKYRAPETVQGLPMSDFTGPFNPQNLYLIQRSTQLPDLENNTEVMVFNTPDEIGFRMKMYDKNIKRIKLSETNAANQVYGAENIEIFLADGKSPGVCYHFLIGANGKYAASRCEATNWNWSWHNNAKVTAEVKSDHWQLTFRLPKSDINAGKTCKFTLIRNHDTAGSRRILGLPAGGAFFNTAGYLTAE